MAGNWFSISLLLYRKKQELLVAVISTILLFMFLHVLGYTPFLPNSSQRYGKSPEEPVRLQLFGVGKHMKKYFERVHHCPRPCLQVAGPGSEEKADAVLFNVFQLEHMAVPEHRRGQLNVYINYESQMRTSLLCTPEHHRPFGVLDDFYNITVTFKDHPDTDILVTYGHFRRRTDEDESVDVMSMKTIKEKTAAVAWMLGNCEAPNTRMEYYRELSLYINIDVYGKCGLGVCDERNGCLANMTKTYRFYLSFENSYCNHYITEKAFRPYELKMIPIVLGGTNYSKVLPPHSYIDVRDYGSPGKLADYLHYLMKNDTAYQEYFTWVKDYVVEPGATTGNKSVWCQLCDFIGDPNSKYKSGFSISRYWDPRTDCLDIRDERKAVHLV